MATPNEELAKDVGQDKATQDATDKYTATHGAYKEMTGGKAATLKPSVDTHQPFSLGSK